MNNEKRFWCVAGSTPQTEQEKHAEIMKSISHGAVEIGCLNGETSSTMCRANPKVMVYSIDPLIPDSMEASLIGSVDRIRQNTKAFSNFMFIQDYSFNVAPAWDRAIDYVFIDGDHNFDAVKKDFEDWFPKIMSGGFISFHDSAMYRGGPGFHVGSSRFVDEVVLQDPRLEYVETVFCLTVFRKK